MAPPNFRTVNNLELFETDDGSHSIRIPDLGETYHSRFGAITESQHVFIANGLQHIFNKTNEQVRLLEVGFGTGLNTLLTCLESYQLGREIEYWVLEPYPIPLEMANQLNFQKFLPKAPQNWLAEMHSCPWNNLIHLSPDFKFKKLELQIQDFDHEAGYFNLVYFDAFAPGKQPDIWDCKIITKVVTLMSTGGVLVSYSAQGKFRRCLQSAGCQAERIEGPPGKLHMLRAIKN